MKKLLPAGLWAALILASAGVDGAVVTAEKGTASDFNETSLPASGTDLINTGPATLSSVSYTGLLKYGNLADCHDGTVFTGSPSANAGTVAHSTVFTTGSTLTFYLNTTARPQGYNIVYFRSITAYTQPVRTGQCYTLSMRTSGSGTFTDCASVTATPYASGSGGGMQRVTVTGDNGALLATGVDAIRLTFNNDPGNPGYEDVYREFDAFGTEEGATTLSTDDILFYTPFESTTTAQIAAGQAQPVCQNNPQYTTGYTGQGIWAGLASEQVQYATAGNLELDSGTLSLWVKPLDWGANDPYTRCFFGVGGTGGFAWLYKYGYQPVYWLVQHTDVLTKVNLVAPASVPGGSIYYFTWAQNTWTHLLATWSGNQMSLFINGNYCGVAYVPTATLLQAWAPAFYIGNQNDRGTNGMQDTVLDDVLILRRSVNPQEAQWIYCLGYPNAFANQTIGAVRVDASFVYLLTPNALKFDISLVGKTPSDMTGNTWVCNYVIKRDGTPQLSGDFPLTSVRTIRQVDVSSLDNASYSVHISLTKNGTAVTPDAGSHTDGAFQKQAPPAWIGNSVGVDTAVPSPWTSVKRLGDDIRCWGRTYTMNQAFPTQIISQSQNFLMRPVTLRARIGSTDTFLQTADVTCNTTPLHTTFTATASLGGTPVIVNGWMEFDGFLWFDITLQGGSTPLNLSSLILEVPFDVSKVPLMYGREPIPFYGPSAGSTAPFQGSLQNPLYWFGNEKAGVVVVMRDYRDWQCSDRGNMVTLQIVDGEAVLRFNLIDHAMTVDQTLNYSLGLEATPVRPLPTGWRQWEFELNGVNTSLTSTRKVWQYFFWPQWNLHPEHVSTGYGPFGYPQSSSLTWSNVDELISRNSDVWQYWLQEANWIGDPVMMALGGEWASGASWGAGASGAYNADAGPFDSIVVNHDIASFRDYQVWARKDVFDNLSMNPRFAWFRGIYIDLGDPTWFIATSETGTSSYIFDVLGTRELQKRYYRMIKQNWPRLLVSNHTCYPHNLSKLAFSDMTLTGENLQPPALRADGNYYNIMNLNLLRAGYLASKFGVPAVFEPFVICNGGPATGPEAIAAAEHLYGMLWIHDVIPWAANINTTPFLQAGRAKDAFGWDDDVIFRGYWENQTLIPITPGQSQVVVSLFKRPGKAMFVVMNNTDNDTGVTMAPLWASLGIARPNVLIDAYAEQARDANDQSILPVPTVSVDPITGASTFTVGRRNFKAWVAR